jgi:hypothetical protein
MANLFNFFNKKPVFDIKTFANNTKLMQQQLLDLTKSSMADDVVKVRVTNIIDLLDTPVTTISSKEMEILDGYLFSILISLRDSLAQKLPETIDYSLTILQNLIIENRNQGKLLKMLQEIKGMVANLVEYSKIDSINKINQQSNNRLVEIKRHYELKKDQLNEIEVNNLKREITGIRSRLTNNASILTDLQKSKSNREKQLDVLRDKETYQQMVENQIFNAEEFKEAVADIQLIKKDLTANLNEVENIADVYTDANLKQKDGKSLGLSLDDMLKNVDGTTQQSTTTPTQTTQASSTNQKLENELDKLLEDIK